MTLIPALTVGPGGDISWLAVAIMVAALILLIALVAFLSGRKARRRASEAQRVERPLSPRELLDRRLAAGEITKDEYEEQAILIGGGGEASNR